MLQQIYRPNTIIHRTIHAEGKWGRRYRQSPTYVIVTFWKFWCKSNFVQVRNEYSHGQLYPYVCICKEVQLKSTL